MIIHDCIQGPDDWYKLRLGKVTASCFGKAIAAGQGKTRKTYMIQLIAERLTQSEQEGFSSAVMVRGQEIEPYAREYYELLNDVSIREVGFVERNENIGASPDGFIGEDGLIEIKCPLSTTHIATILADKVPTTHKPQIQGQLWVCEREWCDFVSYDPRVRQRPFFCERVYRDEDYIKELHIKIQMFIDEMNQMMQILTKPVF
ncbi:hypothetical protein LCGC14_0743280 [marine sediment metagenome]|uniref:YqaJ viral recombinase domain-containing protein n=1 Tax=marine sediment metagenome TaxID=412755 RepID=A0A0F9TD77_9ZZZZ